MLYVIMCAITQGNLLLLTLVTHVLTTTQPTAVVTNMKHKSLGFVCYIHVHIRQWCFGSVLNTCMCHFHVMLLRGISNSVACPASCLHWRLACWERPGHQDWQGKENLTYLAYLTYSLLTVLPAAIMRIMKSCFHLYQGFRETCACLLMMLFYHISGIM